MINTPDTRKPSTGSCASWKDRLVRLVKLNSSPAEIALGVSIGVFIAVLPLYGLHTVLVILAALLVKRANKLAILLGTSVSTTLTLPFITWAGYSIGKRVLGGDFPPLGWEIFRNLSFQALLDMYRPLFAGSLVLALGMAVIFYYLVFLALAIRLRSKRS